MKKNGFTFIEILGVITLLALISVIILLVVDKRLKDSKQTLSEIQVENIKSAASMWRTDHIDLIPDDGYYYTTLGDLVNAGYIDADIINPNSGNNYSLTTQISIGIDEVIVP